NGRDGAIAVPGRRRRSGVLAHEHGYDDGPTHDAEPADQVAAVRAGRRLESRRRRPAEELRVTTDAAVDLFSSMMLIATKVAGPMLLVALLVGLVVGVLQAATSVNEASISFVTKLVAISGAFVVLGPWIIQQL